MNKPGTITSPYPIIEAPLPPRQACFRRFKSKRIQHEFRYSTFSERITKSAEELTLGGLNRYGTTIIMGKCSLEVGPPLATRSITDSPVEVNSGVTNTKKISYRNKQESRITPTLIEGSLRVCITNSIRKMPRIFCRIHDHDECRKLYHRTESVIARAVRTMSAAVALTPKRGITRTSGASGFVNCLRIKTREPPAPIAKLIITICTT
mmetsp:Transcript_20694/g.84028  ORF Transcript_20694/g.84028 Transcript_20694/m.84028 type:complete len:208 (-) Transcript_20694:778-1401(-)